MTTTAILIIEDDIPIQAMYKLKLEREGYKVFTASNGVEGLAVANDVKPQLILLDLLLPEMNGDEVLTRLRASAWGANARVIILTNISKDEAPAKLRLLHVDRYVVKAHYTPMQVLDTVKEVLNDHNANK